jgi:hypothetical protein
MVDVQKTVLPVGLALSNRLQVHVSLFLHFVKETPINSESNE